MNLWKKAEELFVEADLHKPEEHRFQGWTRAQTAAYELWLRQPNHRQLLFYPTGTGKTKTSLALLYSAGFESMVVIAPPKTHSGWIADAKTLGVTIKPMSVQKFRMADTKLPKDTPIIVDEFHQTGKHGGPAFKKLERMARFFPGIILASATPEYNDADRVYCAAKIIEPEKHMGGYLAWVQRNCHTSPNPFAITPYIDGLIGYEGEDAAAQWLVDQGWCAYIEDTADWEAIDLEIESDWDPTYFDQLGFDESQTRIMASDMEARHRIEYLLRVDPETGRVRNGIMEELIKVMQEGDKPWLVFCHHETIARALMAVMSEVWETYLITGTQSGKEVEQNKQGFLKSTASTRVLIGTSALATGVDGIDKVCDRLLIFDDIVGDHSLRRQLIGRVLPRGTYQRDTTVVTAIVTRSSEFN